MRTEQEVRNLLASLLQLIQLTKEEDRQRDREILSGVRYGLEWVLGNSRCAHLPDLVKSSIEALQKLYADDD